jgi:periplasmic divalent cation tolerance protein
MVEDVLLVLTTWPDAETARGAARAIVGERLAACANMVSNVESIYRWKEKVEENGEVLMILKTTAARYAGLAARIKELHPYEVPEILCFRAIAGEPAYVGWVADSCDLTGVPEKGD